MVAIFAAHGATFLTLRMSGDSLRSGGRDGRRLSVPAAILGIAIVAWTVVVAHDRNNRDILPPAVPAALTAIALLLAALLMRAAPQGWAFAATGAGAVGFVATIFTGLYPRVLVSHPSSTTASRSPTPRPGTTRSRS